MTFSSRYRRAAALVLLLPLPACMSGPSYWRVMGESGERQPSESLSFEVRDYGDLARLFVDELKQSPLYARLQAGDPESKTTPAIAHKEFRIDMSDRNTKASIMEQRLRVELQRAGVRYINEQERQEMIEALKRQHSDLNDPATRAEFGKFANARSYLVGRMYDVTHAISLSQKKREFHLVVDLVDPQTLVSSFACDVAITKYMEN
jgi:hypothetical protein